MCKCKQRIVTACARITGDPLNSVQTTAVQIRCNTARLPPMRMPSKATNSSLCMPAQHRQPCTVIGQLPRSVKRCWPLSLAWGARAPPTPVASPGLGSAPRRAPVRAAGGGRRVRQWAGSRPIWRRAARADGEATAATNRVVKVGRCRNPHGWLADKVYLGRPPVWVGWAPFNATAACSTGQRPGRGGPRGGGGALPRTAAVLRR